ncbi:MAG: type II secretion system protein [Alphaproteobacteria bacterium]
MLQRRYRKDGGFTLLELAAVLTITGLSMLYVARFFNIYMENKRLSVTQENIELVYSALREYAAYNGAYLCPADPTLEPSDPLYGRSQCRGAGYDPNGCADLTEIGAGITCTNEHSRDIDNDGTGDTVVIGAVPIRTLVDELDGLSRFSTPIRELHKTDGYGTLISYAVTERLTEANPGNSTLNPFNPLQGAIRVVDENGISLMDPEDEGQFLVFSHGRDALGGYSPNGDLIEPCFIPSVIVGNPPEPPPPGPFDNTGQQTIKVENCDGNDAIFVRGLLSTANNSNYFDDSLYFKGRDIGALWKTARFSDNPGDVYIYNGNLGGSVGLDTAEPNATLDVAGDINTNTEVRSANNIDPDGDGDFDHFCDPTHDHCIDVNFLGGDGEQGGCPAGQVAYGVENNRMVCRDVDWSEVRTAAKTCQAISGETSYMQGFSNKGNVLCCTLTGTCEKQ